MKSKKSDTKVEDKSFENVIKNGKKITREAFREGSYLEVKDNKVFDMNGNELFIGERDKKSNDWIIVK